MLEAQREDRGESAKKLTISPQPALPSPKGEGLDAALLE
jgi:hypothetical protein